MPATPPAPLIFRGEVREGDPARALNRVVARDGTGSVPSGELYPLVKRADVAASGIKYTAYDLGAADPTAAIATAVQLTTSTVLSDTLATDWDEDATGYNFAVTLPASLFTGRGGSVVRVLFSFTLTGGATFTVPWDLAVKDLVP